MLIKSIILNYNNNNKIIRLKMKLKFSKEEDYEIIRFLRYRNTNPNEDGYSYMGLKDIAKHMS